jgi:Ssp1 endopeptidase immunity protein Rap1a
MKKNQVCMKWQMVSKLLIFGVLSVVPTIAQSVDCGHVRTQCESALKSGGPDSQCASYMRGLLDANGLWVAAMKDKNQDVLKKFYCAPDDLPANEAAKVYVEWIKCHPDYESRSAANAFILAMREKYHLQMTTLGANADSLA